MHKKLDPLNRSEMHAALRSIGLELKDGDVAGMMESMDRDGDGRVSYTEFCEGVAQYGGLRRRKGKSHVASGGGKTAQQWGRMVVKPSPPKTPKPPTTMAVKVRVGVTCQGPRVMCRGVVGLWHFALVPPMAMTVGGCSSVSCGVSDGWGLCYDTETAHGGW